MKNIEETKWARAFKKECPTSYLYAIELAEKLQDGRIPFVNLNHQNETGEWSWAICPYDEFGSKDCSFWLDATKTKKEAVAICKEMGWKIFK